MGLPENGASPATERLDAGTELDAILAEGRTPDPSNTHELRAHGERARRRVAEKHRPASVPPPHSSTNRRRPADSAVVIVIVIVAALALGGGILLGLAAHEAQLGATLTSWAGWWPL